jgi:hypothetical protein
MIPFRRAVAQHEISEQISEHSCALASPAASPSVMIAPVPEKRSNR